MSDHGGEEMLSVESSHALFMCELNAIWRGILHVHAEPRIC